MWKKRTAWASSRRRRRLRRVTFSVKSEELKCELCDAVCLSISHLQTHTLSEHVPSRKTSASSCSSSITAAAAANNTSVQRVACQQCDDTFDTFAQFAVHMRSHIGGSSGSASATLAQIYYCPVCPVGVAFRDKKSQLEHITTQHIQMQLTQFVCSECESIFSTASNLAVHFWESHVKRKFLCAHCEFVADTDKAFKEHSKVHSRQIVMFGCAVCGQAFAAQQNLINHVQIAHDPESIYPPTLLSKPSSTPSPKSAKPRALQCSVCDETVFGEDGLDEHRLQRHCKVRHADKCADCHERIDSDASFVEHCLRHTKDHAHHCPVCRQSLRSDAQIHAHCSYHMKKTAECESPNQTELKKDDDFNSYSFVCPICGEKTDDGFALIEHSKQHL